MSEVQGYEETESARQGFEVVYKDDEARLGRVVETMRRENIRPVGMFAVSRQGAGQTEFLLAKSATAKKREVWALPQGKIEPGEDLGENIFRELSEEHYVSQGDIVTAEIGIIEPKTIAYGPERLKEEAERGRLERGKGYIASHVRLKPDTNVSFNPGEAADIKWVNLPEARELINNSQIRDEAKKQLMIAALEAASE